MSTLAEIVPLELAEVTFPPSHPLAGSRGVVNGFLILHPDALILVDNGIGSGSEAIDDAYKPRRTSFETLDSWRVTLQDIDAVVNTHLHFDHCGGNPLFANTPIYVQSAEYEAAFTERYTVSAWVDFPGATYEAKTGDFQILPGVNLLSTPGHTQGHQSILVETADGPVLIAGQAIYSKTEYEHIRTHCTLLRNDPPPDPDAYLSSALRLMEMHPIRVYFSHDDEVWRTQFDE